METEQEERVIGYIVLFGKLHVIVQHEEEIGVMELPESKVGEY